MAKNKTVIKKSKIHGYGVFAETNIRKGSIISTDPYLVLTYDNIKKSELESYVYSYLQNNCIIVFGNGSIFNHCNEENVFYRMDCDNKVFEYIAARGIKKGEELFINYGKKYWKKKLVL